MKAYTYKVRATRVMELLFREKKKKENETL